MKFLYAFVFMFCMTTLACAGSNGSDGSEGPQGPPGQSIPVVSPPPTLTPVQQIAANYNEYLVSVGSDPITPGLRCTLYAVPNMPASPCLVAGDVTGCTTISTSSGYSSIGSWTYVGAVDQANEVGTSGFNMLPEALQPLYPTNFAMTCTGYYINPDYNYHEFSLASDDGSVLYLNGQMVVQNDGEHGVQTSSGVKYLQAAVNSLTLMYFQGPGYVALQAFVDGQPMSAANLYH